MPWCTQDPLQRQTWQMQVLVVWVRAVANSGRRRGLNQFACSVRHAQVQHRRKTSQDFCGAGPELFGDLVMWPVLALAIQGLRSLLAFLGGPPSCCTAQPCTVLSTEDTGSRSVLLGGCRSTSALKGREQLPHVLAFLKAASLSKYFLIRTLHPDLLKHGSEAVFSSL